MNETDEKMLDWVEFVTDKFSANHEPWKYTRDTGDLEHIRYKRDYTGYEHWTNRVKRFLNWITVSYWKPSGIWKELSTSEKFWYKLKNWHRHIASWWRVEVRKDSNIPDGVVNGNITHWEEDGEYIAMFCPYVGREVLKFLRAEPDNPFAEKILQAMRETQEVSWGDNEEEEC